MAELKRDRVNRQEGTIVLPIDCPAEPGEEVELRKVKERDINCAVRDPNEMYDPYIGSGIGDAVFDAGLGAQTPKNVCDAGKGGGAETYYILAENKGILTHAGVRYLQER